MPALPELLEVAAEIGVVEVLAHAHAGDPADADRQVRRRREVQVETEREGVHGTEERGSRRHSRVAEERLRKGEERIGHEELLAEPEHDPLEAEHTVLPGRSPVLELAREVPRTLDGPRRVGGQEEDGADEGREADVRGAARRRVQEVLDELEREVGEADDARHRHEAGARRRPELERRQERHAEGDRHADDPSADACRKDRQQATERVDAERGRDDAAERDVPDGGDPDERHGGERVGTEAAGQDRGKDDENNRRGRERPGEHASDESARSWGVRL